MSKSTIPPLQIRIDKTVKGEKILKNLNCNLNCIWCHKDFFNHKPGIPAITNTQIVKAVKLIITASLRPKARLNISGQGEPTLVGTNELSDLITRLRSIPQVSNIKLITNGILLTSMVKKLASAGLDAVTVSLNSLNPKTYQQITHQNHLDKAKMGVRAAVKAGLKTKINVVYCQLNANEVEEYIKFSRANGGIIVKFFDLLTTNISCHKLYLPLNKLQTQLEDLASSKECLTIPYHACKYHFTKPKATIVVKTAGSFNQCPNTACQHRKKCLEGCRTSVRISQDGVLHPCGVRTDNTINLFKNGKNTSIEKVKEALHSGGKNDQF